MFMVYGCAVTVYDLGFTAQEDISDLSVWLVVQGYCLGGPWGSVFGPLGLQLRYSL